MTIQPEHGQEQMQRYLDELIGDRVEFTIHDGDPGPECTDNLAFGDGLPQSYSFTEGGSVAFNIPVMPYERIRVPVPRRWWQIRRRYRIHTQASLVRIEAVTLWSKGRPMLRVDAPTLPITLVGGGVLIITPNGKPQVQGLAA